MNIIYTIYKRITLLYLHYCHLNIITLYSQYIIGYITLL